MGVNIGEILVYMDIDVLQQVQPLCFSKGGSCVSERDVGRHRVSPSCLGAGRGTPACVSIVRRHRVSASHLNRKISLPT